MRSSDSGMVNLKGWPAAWCGVGCRLWGNMAPAAAGLPRSAVVAARLPALPRLHTLCAKGTGAATPAGRLFSAAAGRSGTRRGSVPPPRGHPPAAASFVAVVPGRDEGGRERRTGRARVDHHRSALLRRRCDRRAAPATPGRGGTGPDGAKRGGNSRPSAAVNNPLHGLASRRCDYKAGNPERRRLLSPLLPLVKRGKSSLRKRDAASAAGPSQTEGARESLQGGTRCSQASAQGPNPRQDTER